MVKALLIGLSLMVVVACKRDFSHLKLKTDTYGHAGESLYPLRNKFPPNSLRSIREVILNSEAEGVEVDVQMTADSVLVLYHGLHLDNHTSGSGCIPSKKYAEIADLFIYRSNEHIALLSDALYLVLNAGKKIMLDVKHYHACEAEAIDFNQFDRALNRSLEAYTSDQKKCVIVNSRDLTLLNTLSDTSLSRSLESDDPDYAIPTMKAHAISLLTIKRSKMSATVQHRLEDHQLKSAVYNVKTKKDVREALEWSPNILITDNIAYTLESIHGEKE